jgi:hypothetical protein
MISSRRASRWLGLFAVLTAAWLRAFAEAPAVSFTVDAASVLENAGSIKVHVMRSGSIVSALSARAITVDGTARAGIDYTLVTGNFSWPAGNNDVLTLTIPILDNAIADGTRSFAVLLTTAVADESVQLASPNPERISILDDEPAGATPPVSPPQPVSAPAIERDINIVHLSRNESACFAIASENGGAVRIRIYDRLGREIRTLSSDVPSGGAPVYWDGRDAGGAQVKLGVYYAQIESPDGRRTQKIAVVE